MNAAEATSARIEPRLIYWIDAAGSLILGVALALTAGTLTSLAGWTQNRWHELWGWDPARGWDHQLRSEPGLNLVWVNKQRYRWHAQPQRSD